MRIANGPELGLDFGLRKTDDRVQEDNLSLHSKDSINFGAVERY